MAKNPKWSRCVSDSLHHTRATVARTRRGKWVARYMLKYFKQLYIVN